MSQTAWKTLLKIYFIETLQVVKDIWAVTWNTAWREDDQIEFNLARILKLVTKLKSNIQSFVKDKC